MKKVLRSILFLILIFFISEQKICAQQLPQFAYGSVNPEFYNTAVSGIAKTINASAIGRTQWVNITGHPISQALIFSSYIQKLRGGLGLCIMNNQQGVQRNTYAMIGYSYIIETKKSRIGIGARAGIIQSSLNGSELKSPEGNYYSNIFDHNDPFLPLNLVSSSTPDLSAGIFLLNKHISVGVAGAHLLQSKINYQLPSNNLQVNLERNLSASVSININKGGTLSFKPSIFAKYDFNNLQSETSLLIGYKKIGWIGVGYRGLSTNHSDALIGFIGLRANDNLLIGYAYEYSLSKLSSANDGSHELMLNYSISLTRDAKPDKIIFTPRF